MNRSIILSCCLSLMALTAGYAQKFGFCNSSALLSEIPEMKQADTELKSFQTQLQKKGQKMVKDFQDMAADVKRREEEGTISPKDLKTQNEKLVEEQKAIEKYEQEVYDKLAQKRDELFSPILDTVNVAMEEVAKELGYIFVFDTNSNALLYADESLDVTKKVQEKLKLKG